VSWYQNVSILDFIGAKDDGGSDNYEKCKTESNCQGWAQGRFVEAEAEVEAERSRRGKAAMSLTEARQGRGRELEAEARQTKFEARPRRGDPLKKILLP